MFIFERRRDSSVSGEGQKETDTESEAARLPAVSTESDSGPKPMNHEILT